jgi:hypothetical protein
MPRVVQGGWVSAAFLARTPLSPESHSCIWGIADYRRNALSNHSEGVVHVHCTN